MGFMEWFKKWAEENNAVASVLESGAALAVLLGAIVAWHGRFFQAMYRERNKIAATVWAWRGAVGVIVGLGIGMVAWRGNVSAVSSWAEMADRENNSAEKTKDAPEGDVAEGDEPPRRTVAKPVIPLAPPGFAFKGGPKFTHKNLRESDLMPTDIPGVKRCPDCRKLLLVEHTPDGVLFIEVERAPEAP